VNLEDELFIGNTFELWLCGRNSCGSLEVVEPFTEAVLRIVVLLPVTPTIIIPTTLVASPTTPPMIPVASLTILLTSLMILAITAAPPLKTTEICVGLSTAALDWKAFPCEETSFATFEPLSRIADATFVTSPKRPPRTGERAFTSVGWVSCGPLKQSYHQHLRMGFQSLKLGWSSNR
jgi:hypothetical protein